MQIHFKFQWYIRQNLYLSFIISANPSLNEYIGSYYRALFVGHFSRLISAIRWMTSNILCSCMSAQQHGDLGGAIYTLRSWLFGVLQQPHLAFTLLDLQACFPTLPFCPPPSRCPFKKLVCARNHSRVFFPINLESRPTCYPQLLLSLL